MYNILLDPLPEDYKGWLIRTDYRIGIQIALCLQDADLDEQDRLMVALSLLYGAGCPPLETAVDGLTWFLRCGEEPRESESGEKPVFWFDFDHARIMASFRQTYGLELHKAKLHWFEFRAMLESLNEDSALSHAIQARGTDTSKMKGKQRSNFERLKRQLTPPVRYTEEEQRVMDDFWAQFEKKEKTI